jgi:hypothetical protein
MSITETTIDALVAERVQNGVEWLDAHRKGWRNDIDIDNLNLGDPWSCVLGQIAQAIGGNGFADLCSPSGGEGDPCVLDLLNMTRRMTEDEAIERGFEFADGYGYRDLDEAWKQVLR